MTYTVFILICSKAISQKSLNFNSDCMWLYFPCGILMIHEIYMQCMIHMRVTIYILQSQSEVDNSALEWRYTNATFV